MFELPSLWNLIISTVVFFVAVWYFRRLLDEQGIPKGMTRSLLVFVLASVVSWGSGAIVDWIQGPQPEADTARDMTQLLKQVGGEQP
ncbi:MAG TPA: hypothetical protein VFP33_03665 [Gallionella sp.]|nr:hypothetical protein [Gallionella sp.]